MSNFRVREVPYKQARRVLRRLREKHSDEFLQWALFCEADREICPELYTEPETQYGSSCNELDDRLLNTVADSFGIDPVLLDDVLIAAGHEEQRMFMGAALP